jgi:Fur family zinc uptake transcriptional regulator
MTGGLTRNQALVLGTLTEAAQPMSAYAILDHLRPAGLKAPLQVYRALERLVAEGLVHRLESLNAFIACTHGETDRMAVFLICDRCGTVDEEDAPSLGSGIAALAGEHGFQPKAVMLEIKGLCQACRAVPGAGSCGPAGGG